MDRHTYENWQELHRLVAIGGPLDAEQQAAYDEGCQEMDQDEDLDRSLDRLFELHKRVKESQAEQWQLLRHAADLDARINLLEAHLDEKTRHFLGIGA